ncbi:MAG: HD domain-containing protein [Victivallaceae bacterium]
MIRETSYGQTFGELYRETEDLFNTVDDGCHDFDHTLRVLHNAELLLTHYPAANKEVVRLAALLHDIGRVGESKTAGAPCHAETGAAKAVQMLLSHGYDMPTAVQVGEAVRTHRYRGDAQPETLEGQIIFDADKLDSLGAVGIGRAFLFAGMVGARVHNTAETALSSPAYGREDTAYREYLVKLRHIPEKMFTDAGRVLAHERLKFMEEFFARLNLEVYDN